MIDFVEFYKDYHTSTVNRNQNKKYKNRSKVYKN